MSTSSRPPCALNFDDLRSLVLYARDCETAIRLYVKVGDRLTSGAATSIRDIYDTWADGPRPGLDMLYRLPDAMSRCVLLHFREPATLYQKNARTRQVEKLTEDGKTFLEVARQLVALFNCAADELRALRADGARARDDRNEL